MFATKHFLIYTLLISKALLSFVELDLSIVKSEKSKLNKITGNLISLASDPSENEEHSDKIITKTIKDI